MHLFAVVVYVALHLSSVHCSPRKPGLQVERECSRPPTIENADLHENAVRERYPVGSTIYYTCDTGFGLIGDPRMHCIESQNTLIWTVQKFSCLRSTCSSPEKPTNGIVIGTDYSLGMLITFECNRGYKMWSTVLDKEITVPPVRMCMTDGEWNGYTPDCKPLTCLPPKEIENGFAEMPSSLIYSSRVAYHCLDGYKLIGPKYRICDETSSWSDEEPHCKYIVPDVQTTTEVPLLEPKDGKKRTIWEQFKTGFKNLWLKIKSAFTA